MSRLSEKKHERLGALFTSYFFNWVKNRIESLYLEGFKGNCQTDGRVIRARRLQKIINRFAGIEGRSVFITFDRQVRYTLYLRDQNKAMVIEEVLGWLE